MAEALHTERLKSLMECSICLDEFDEPKMLLCGHQFCKLCLEDIIEFKADGSGAISCPLRCDVQTFIDVDQTINDLQTSYVLKGMLDVLKTGEVDPHIPKCTYQTSCPKSVSTYCCETMMCNTCFVNHEKTVEHRRQQRRKVDLSYDKRENQLKVFCTEHSTRCSHLCIDSKFLCTYCIYRNEDHKGHAKNTVNADVELLKEALVIDSVKNENIAEFRKLTVENIWVIRKKLDNLLERRMEECICRYTDFLRKEKEILKSKFENICADNINQYPTNGLSSYNREILEKSDIVLAIEKDKILETILNVNKLSLICETVSFSENFGFRSEHPLGKIKVTTAEEVLLSSPPIPTVKDNIKLDSVKGEHNEERDGGIIRERGVKRTSTWLGLQPGQSQPPPSRFGGAPLPPPPPPPPGIFGIFGSASAPSPRPASRPSATISRAPPPPLPPQPPGIFGIFERASAPSPQLVGSRPSATVISRAPPPPQPPGIFGMFGSASAPSPQTVASQPSATVINSAPPPPQPPGIFGNLGSASAPSPRAIASRLSSRVISRAPPPPQPPEIFGIIGRANASSLQTIASRPSATVISGASPPPPPLQLPGLFGILGSASAPSSLTIPSLPSATVISSAPPAPPAPPVIFGILRSANPSPP